MELSPVNQNEDEQMPKPITPVVNSPEPEVIKAEKTRDSDAVPVDSDRITLPSRQSFLESGLELLGRVRLDSYDAVPPPTKPPLHLRRPLEFYSIIVGGCLLTLNAGFMNAVTMDLSGFASSHVTGTLAKSALYLIENDPIGFYRQILLVPFHSG